MIVGADPEASVYEKLKLVSEFDAKVTVTVCDPVLEHAGT